MVQVVRETLIRSTAYKIPNHLEKFGDELAASFLGTPGIEGVGRHGCASALALTCDVQDRIRVFWVPIQHLDRFNGWQNQ